MNELYFLVFAGEIELAEYLHHVSQYNLPVEIEDRGAFCKQNTCFWSVITYVCFEI